MLPSQVKLKPLRTHRPHCSMVSNDYDGRRLSEETQTFDSIILFLRLRTSSVGTTFKSTGGCFGRANGQNCARKYNFAWG